MPGIGSYGGGQYTMPASTGPTNILGGRNVDRSAVQSPGGVPAQNGPRPTRPRPVGNPYPNKGQASYSYSPGIQGAINYFGSPENYAGTLSNILRTQGWGAINDQSSANQFMGMRPDLFRPQGNPYTNPALSALMFQSPGGYAQNGQFWNNMMSNSYQNPLSSYLQQGQQGQYPLYSNPMQNPYLSQLLAQLGINM